MGLAGCLAFDSAGTTAIRIRLLDMPLERDEGEYAYAGQLLLQGVPPYLQVYTMKWPGTHAAYALIMAVFGQTAAGIHLGLILVAIATAVLVFLLARRLYGDVAGAVRCRNIRFALGQPSGLWACRACGSFCRAARPGRIVLLQNLDDSVARTRVFFAGLLARPFRFDEAAGGCVRRICAAWITWNEISRPSPQWRRLALRLAYLMLGGVLPLLLTGFVLIGAGAFDSFWFWTVEYARFYGSLFTPAEGIQDFWEATAGKLFKAAPGLWCLAVPGLLLLFYERSVRHSRFFVLGFLFVSCLAICPGWYFRPHYFLLLIPATSLLAGVAVCAACRWLARLRAPVCSTVLPLLIFAGAAAGRL